MKRRKQRSTRRRRKRRKKHRRRRSRAIAASTAPPWTIAVEWDDKTIWYTPNSKDDNNKKIGAKATAADLIKAVTTGPARLFSNPVSADALNMYYLEGAFLERALRLPNNTFISAYLRNGGRSLVYLRHETNIGTSAYPIDLTLDSPDPVAARSHTLRHRLHRRKRKQSRGRTHQRKKRRKH